MSSRIVACFRYRGATTRAHTDELVTAAADALVGRAGALGGRVVAWHAGGVAFDFAPDALEDAIDLVLDAEPGALECFGIGIAAGRLDSVLDAGMHVALCRGAALVRATHLAEIARGGEVLLDATLELIHRGRLLANGSRLGMIGRDRVRGARLDLHHPWRPEAPEHAAHVVRVARVGTALPTQLVVESGKVAVLRAERGAGGTRFLDDLADAEPSGRVLALTPYPIGEPLGALRMAFVRALAAGVEGLTLPDEHVASLESLLAGEGLDAETSGALIAAWLSPRGLLLVDDAIEIDADSIGAIAEATTGNLARVAVRIAPGAMVPAPLRELPRAGELVLEPLGAMHSAELVRSSVGGELLDRAAARFARRGGGSPLATREALLEAIQGADLVPVGNRLMPRVRHAGRGRAHPAIHWVNRRLAFVPVVDQPVLAAVAILGGEAEPEMLGTILDRAAVEISHSIDGLIAARWLQRTAGGTVGLTSATQREALVAALDPDERARLHRAVAAIHGASERPLAAAAACVHALLAGDRENARALARRAAAAARASGLGSTADALERFSAGGIAHMLVDRGLAGGFAASVAPESGAGVTERAPPSRPAIAVAPRMSIMAGVEGNADHGQAHAVALALRDGDYEKVEKLVDELRAEGEHDHVADRVEAMACLARGETSEALRLLRRARDLSRRLGPAERSRAALAHGVGLAAAGRDTEALLEALAGLARAREAGDANGERACARFLAKLSRSSGEEEAAVAWEAIAGV